MIKRYGCRTAYGGCEIYPSETGTLVKLEDHQSELERVKGLLRECETFLMIVEPRSNKADAYALLKQIKEACDER